MARGFKRLGRYICRYDIPEEGGIIWEQTIAPGHYDLRGDSEILKRYLVGCIEELSPHTARELRESDEIRPVGC